jgi:hypothetical protein
MILSHKHKFIFVKGQKVAGTSAEIALSQVCGPDDIVTPITPADERYRIGTAGEPRNYASRVYPSPFRRGVERRFVQSIKNDSAEQLGSIRLPRSRFFNHMDLQSVLRLAADAKDYEILAVERSPYAKVMSLANWVENQQSYRKAEGLKKDPARLANGVDRLLSDGSIRKVLNIVRYRDLDGRVTVKPWRMDRLADDMAAFLRSRGLEPVALVNAKEGAKSDSLDPATILRPDQIEAINEIFKEEFERFGWPVLG